MSPIPRETLKQLRFLVTHPLFEPTEFCGVKRLSRLDSMMPALPLYSQTFTEKEGKAYFVHHSLVDVIIDQLRNPVVQKLLVFKASKPNQPIEVYHGSLMRESQVFGYQFFERMSDHECFELGSDVKIKAGRDAVAAIAHLSSIYFESDGELCCHFHMYRQGK